MSALATMAMNAEAGPGAIHAVYETGHVFWDITYRPDEGVTFALFPGRAAQPNAPILFSGVVSAEMPGELRRLADYLDYLSGVPATIPDDDIALLRAELGLATKRIAELEMQVPPDVRVLQDRLYDLQIELIAARSKHGERARGE